MNSERWERVKELLDLALERPVEERAEFIASQAGNDAELAAEVTSLLEAYESPGPLEHVARFPPQPPLISKDFSGLLVGPYRLEREVGRGGMGVVYLATRVEGGFDQRVAIKLAPQALVSDTILARFTAEREILARLDHPNIARLLDGGVTEEGWPYLVMEFVEGEPITRRLATDAATVDRKLDVVRTVCDAVHYAHKNLVVHRDLKPSNILIDSEGNVKLLDFGIAKLLAADDDATVLQTRTEGRLLTPAYASPEQFRGQQVTTASDVYSLGIVVYELLAGEHPYALAGLTADQVRSAICDTVPQRPSVARAHVASVGDGRAGGALDLDLDNIVMKALRKEPERRYGSAAQLAEDIRRYQQGLPVQARTPTVKYRFAKFVRRNKAVVAAASVVLIAMLTAVAVTSSQARIATENARTAATERDRAQAAAAKSDRLNDFLRGVLETANPAWWVDRELKGPEVTVLEALDEASRRMETELADDPEIRADIHHTLGETYTELRDQDLAREHFEAALELRQAHYQPPHHKIAESLFYMAVIEARAGNPAAAERLIQQAAAQQRVRNEGNNLPFMLEFYASAARMRGDARSTVKLREEALGAAIGRYGQDSPTAELFRLNVARARLESGDLEGARTLIVTGSSPSPSARSLSRRLQARLLAREHKFAEAERLWPLDEKDAGGPTPATISVPLTYSEEILLPQGKFDESLKIARATIDFLDSLEPEAYERSFAGRALGVEAMVHALEGRSIAAETEARRALQLFDEYGEAHRPYFWRERRFADRALARSLTDQMRFVEAEPILLSAYETQHERGLTESALAPALEDLVYLYDRWGNVESASEYRVVLTRVADDPKAGSH